MTDTQKPAPSTWDEVRRLVDELQLDMHLARMEVRERWEAVQPQITEIERRLKHAGETVANDITSLGVTLHRLAEDRRAAR